MNIQRLVARHRDRGGRTLDKPSRRDGLANRRRLTVEGLEPRLLLYAANGGVWPHPELVTVSFMPDGTDIGGMPNVLQSSMNLRFPTATWQKEILRGFQSYAANANLNFSVSADDGSPFNSCGGSGSDCNMQGDSNFGDARIGGFALGGPLGISMLPPPLNRDTTAGDMFLNTATTWNIGASYDLFTVSAHEAGHSIGLDHSTVTSAVMYDFYNGVKSSLTSDDISGIQSIYGARPQDSFDTAASNETKATATVITSYIDSNKQITLTGLDVTTTADADWYKVTTPSGSSGTMTVKVQSSGLSLLAPKVSLYKGDGTLLATASGSYNSTVTLSHAISSGQNRFIMVEGADNTVFGTGKYGFQINMGTAALPPVNSPNTATPVSGGGGFSSPITGDSFGSPVDVAVTPVIVTSNQSSASERTDDKNDTHSESSVLLAAHEGNDATASPQAAPSGSIGSEDTSSSGHELLGSDLVDDFLSGFGFLSDLFA